MAFDGITIASIVAQLNETIQGGRLYKIAQPEKDELLITIKVGREQHRLFISADASLPLLYLTNTKKIAPQVAPNFCMLLRKHIKNAKILSITQPGLERVVIFKLEHLDELGDVCQKQLIVEIMGKHSNIIFCKMDGTIIDSIKHISAFVSSVREVLPGKMYFIPETQHKKNPLETNYEEFLEQIEKEDFPIYKSVYQGFTGISPIMAQEICYRGNIDFSKANTQLDENDKKSLFGSFQEIIGKINTNEFAPVMYYDGDIPKEYAAIELTCYKENFKKEFDSIFELLEIYYQEKNEITRSRQRSVDLRKIVQTTFERNVKKLDLQKKQLEDTNKKDKYKVWGELINTYGYSVPAGSKSMEALNYYTNETIEIPLKTTISLKENAKKYFDKYGKLKRTYEALSVLTKETEKNVRYLESVIVALDIAKKEEDLIEIREELVRSGYIKKKGKTKKIRKISKPFHYISSDGYHIYVGKNNIQNDALTFQIAIGNDWWFHAKNIPGSHVIVKANNEELPDQTFEEAASLAAHYSKGRNGEKLEVDYTQKKNVKKPKGGNLGFVVYYTNYSMLAKLDISEIEQIED
jgi:predicted ribosome quality control (RQC) complex YloA/Tae2 family protein